MINDCWLNDFLGFEDAPSDCVDVVLTDVLVFIVLVVNGLVGDHLVLVQMGDEWHEKLLRDEELIVSFLINEALLRSPTKLRIC